MSSARLVVSLAVWASGCAVYVPTKVPPPSSVPPGIRVKLSLAQLNSWDGEDEFAELRQTVERELGKLGFVAVGGPTPCDLLLSPRGSLARSGAIAGSRGFITGGAKPLDEASVSVGVRVCGGAQVDELTFPDEYYDVFAALLASGLSRSSAIGAAAAARARPKAAPPAAPAPSPSVAPIAARTDQIWVVFDIEDGASQLGPLTEYLTVQVTQTLGVQVVPRDQVRSRLVEEKAASYRACVDESCQIELGKALAAQKSLATKVLRIGGVCALTGTLYDLKRETIERAASVKSSCEDAALLSAVDQLIPKLK